MAEHKHRRGSDGVSELDEDMGVLLEPAQIEIGSGYTLAVRYDENDRPVVDVKTYGRVDLELLRKEIEGAFPNARIRRNEQSQTVVVTAKNRKGIAATKKKSR